MPLARLRVQRVNRIVPLLHKQKLMPVLLESRQLPHISSPAPRSALQVTLDCHAGIRSPSWGGKSV